MNSISEKIDFISYGKFVLVDKNKIQFSGYFGITVYG